MTDITMLLTLIIFTPAAGGVLLSFLDRKNVDVLRQGAFAVSLVTFLLSVLMVISFDGGSHEMQLVEQYPWIPALNSSYHLGVDGISVLLVLLTCALAPIIMLSSWRAIEDRIKEFQISLLFLQTGMLGVFLAVDLLLFYLFWEAMLIPMYLLIGVWGGERRVYAAVKFIIYTLVGSLLMFVAILYLYNHTGTFDLAESIRLCQENPLSRTEQAWLFAAFALSFAIKVPLFPLHTWLPDAHVEAPTAASVVLAGVLLKMGTYGFLRFSIPLFPGIVSAFLPAICWLSITGIIFGACMALVQNDIKKLIAYSSVSHLGFVMLGLFTPNARGLSGALIQMVNHGLSTGMLFLLVGIIYERRHTRELGHFGGIAKVVPVFSTFFILATLSSIGLPGLNGFIGEFLILLGTFEFNRLYAVLAATGVILGAVYMLGMVKRFLFGPLLHPENEDISDVTPREICYLTPIVAAMVWIGLYPQPLLNLVLPTVDHYLAR